MWYTWLIPQVVYDDMWLVKWELTTMLAGVAFFKCAMSHGHFACFYFYVRTDIRTAVIILLKNCWKAVFFILKFCFFFQTATDSNIVTSQVSVRVFASDFDWVGSETNIPDDSFGGYEIAPSSQILYLDIQTLQLKHILKI